jgi:16S rRNA (cytosine967-C5)-methyltransferase
MTSARAAAAVILAAVLDRHESLEESVASNRRLDSRDEAFARYLAYGVLRWLAALEWIAGQLLDRPLKKRDRDVHFLVLIGLFQLWKDGSAPHAAVHATAETARQLGKNWAVGLINALLRKFQRERTGLLDGLGERAERFAHPGWLLGALQKDWPDDWQAIAEANNQQAPMWLRINRQRTGMRQYRAMLDTAGLGSELLDSCADAVLVRPAVPVGTLPGFAEGLVSVQDAAAQVAADLLNPVEGDRILDACAAPGGKTCHLLERAPGIALTALDRQPERIELISENLLRLGLGCELVATDATDTQSWWDGRPFNKILLDAPCSATGVIRRHPEIKWLRKPQQVQLAVERQRALLDKLWPLLKAGGMLVYATCSVLKSENSKQIHEFLSRHSNAQCGTPGTGDLPGRQIMPGESQQDGFYYAVLRKSVGHGRSADRLWPHPA